MREATTEFEWVFRTTYPAVVRAVFVVVHDRGVAEEIAQDAFVRLYERWRTATDIEQPQAWVRAVAVRKAVRHAQRQRLRRTVSAVDDAAVRDTVVDVDLHRALATLPPRQRAAMALYYLDDRSVAEVARLLDVSESTVKQHLHRARARLAAVLRDGTEVTGDVG